MEKVKEPLRYGQNPSGMATRHFILEDILPVLTAKGMFMRNWMVCFSLMTRRAKTKLQKRETTMPYKLQHLSSASESKST